MQPKHVRTILDKLNIPWRDYEPNDDGWIDIERTHFQDSTRSFATTVGTSIGININHGGYVDHYEHQNFPDLGKGDIVNLVAAVLLNEHDPNKHVKVQCIDWIKDQLGWKKPEISQDQQFAKEWINESKHNNYVMVPNPVWQSKEIGPSEKLVWMALFERCGTGKQSSWPGINTISEDTNLSRSTVIRSLAELEKKGFLAQSKRSKNMAPRRYPLVKRWNADESD